MEDKANIYTHCLADVDDMLETSFDKKGNEGGGGTANIKKKKKKNETCKSNI